MTSNRYTHQYTVDTQCRNCVAYRARIESLFYFQFVNCKRGRFLWWVRRCPSLCGHGRCHRHLTSRKTLWLVKWPRDRIKRHISRVEEDLHPFFGSLSGVLKCHAHGGTPLAIVVTPSQHKKTWLTIRAFELREKKVYLYACMIKAGPTSLLLREREKRCSPRSSDWPVYFFLFSKGNF